MQNTLSDEQIGTYRATLRSPYLSTMPTSPPPSIGESILDEAYAALDYCRDRGYDPSTMSMVLGELLHDIKPLLVTLTQQIYALRRRVAELEEVKS